LNDLDKGIIRKPRDIALESSKPVHSRLVYALLGNDGYSGSLLRLATTRDLGGISGAETRGFWERKAGKALEV